MRKWKAGLFNYPELKGLRFPNVDEFQKGNTAICNDKRFARMPVEVAPSWILIIPAEGIPLMEKTRKQKKLNFEVVEVTNG